MRYTKTFMRVSRVSHVCTSCGQVINPGEKYARWASYDAGEVFTNKMHPECLAMHNEDSADSTWEYIPFSYDRPVKERK